MMNSILNYTIEMAFVDATSNRWEQKYAVHITLTIHGPDIVLYNPVSSNPWIHYVNII